MGLKTVTDQEFNELSETKQKEMRTVFLSNLSYEVDDDRIRDTMVSSGPIVEVRLIKKPDGKSKGYAFVEFEHRDSAVATSYPLATRSFTQSSHTSTAMTTATSPSPRSPMPSTRELRSTDFDVFYVT